MRDYTKTCVLCVNKIKASHKLCGTCYRLYRHCVTDDWFIELEKSQSKQDGIDRKESFFIPYNSSTDLYGEPELQIVTSKKDIGRPPINWSIKNKVLELFDNSVELEKQGKGKRLSLRAIAKLLNNEVGYVTCRNILIEHGRLKTVKSIKQE